MLFPRDRDLKLDVRLDRAEYQPGTDATVDFKVSTAEGRPANSALGVVIFDRAVEERARTDQEFSGSLVSTEITVSGAGTTIRWAASRESLSSKSI